MPVTLLRNQLLIRCVVTSPVQCYDTVLRYRKRYKCVPTLTRQVVHVQRNIEVCSCNRCCGGKKISIAYCECAFVALGFPREMRMRHIICVISGIFPHYLTNGTNFEKKCH
jgi:hypothetical protein